MANKDEVIAEIMESHAWRLAGRPERIGPGTRREISPVPVFVVGGVFCCNPAGKNPVAARRGMREGLVARYDAGRAGVRPAQSDGDNDIT